MQSEQSVLEMNVEQKTVKVKNHVERMRAEVCCRFEPIRIHQHAGIIHTERENEECVESCEMLIVIAEAVSGLSCGGIPLNGWSAVTASSEAMTAIHFAIKLCNLRVCLQKQLDVRYDDSSEARNDEEIEAGQTLSDATPNALQCLLRLMRFSLETRWLGQFDWNLRTRVLR